jgi:hypothetical protein
MAKFTVVVRPGASCFGGDRVISREFVRKDFRSYIWLEAHEVGAGRPDVGKPGSFRTAVWVPGGNDGDGSLSGKDLDDTLARMAAYAAPPDYAETAIPDRLWDMS